MSVAISIWDTRPVPGRVLIVDDHADVRAAVARMLLDSWTVVGEACSAEEALTAAHALRPDLVILDVHLPDRLGFDIVEDLHATGAEVVLTSTHAALEFGDLIARSGAAGFVRKEQLSSDALHGLVERRRT
jgi:two-component system response regulator EvgA